ncbi:MAG TPA: hypothetical protein PLS00_01090 [Niabella sp.]|nr:hypothetical protein [Niabella sp.]
MYISPMPTPLQISKAIATIEHPYPPDDLVKSYKDFLRVRHLLPYYQFNPKVLASIVDLACDLWYSKERISRLSLITVIKQYGSRIKAVKEYYERSKAVLYPFPVEVNKKLCWLFQRTFDMDLPINRRQAEEIKRLGNSLLINAAMSEEEEKWLCDHVEKSFMILNRVLRYPQPSPVISSWARANYTNDLSHNRRAEMVSWLLDEDPGFVVDEQTLIPYFEYLNNRDLMAIRQYYEELEAKEIMDNELGSLLKSTGKRLQTLALAARLQDITPNRPNSSSVNVFTRFPSAKKFILATKKPVSLILKAWPEVSIEIFRIFKTPPCYGQSLTPGCICHKKKRC